MNLQDQVQFRCIHAACARPLPRKVNFCPYCGVSQSDGVRAPAPVQTVAEPAPVVVPAAVVLDKPAPPPPPPPPAPPPVQPAPPTPLRQSVPPPRAPVRMRYWLLALAALWGIWMLTKPNQAKIDARIDNALALTSECKLGEAQGELIALRSGKARADQLQRVQSAINQAAPGCEKKRVRAKAWIDTKAAVDKALDNDDTAKAQSRLAQFTKRYGDDDETRALRDRIGVVRDIPPRAILPAPAPAAPSGTLARDTLSARRLIDEAERDIQAGNYQQASDKMQTCITMVESGTRECASFKVYADRLQSDLRRCLAGGREWIDHHCQ